MAVVTTVEERPFRAARTKQIDRRASAPAVALDADTQRTYPPAMAPTIRNGSFPDATASGSGASGGSCDKSSSHAKNRKNARRCSVPCSRIVPRSIGYRASSASRTDRCVTGPSTSSCTSCPTCASVRRCCGSSIRITAASVPQPTALPADHAQSAPSYLLHRPSNIPARRWCQNKCRIRPGYRRPSRRAAR